MVTTYEEACVVLEMMPMNAQAMKFKGFKVREIALRKLTPIVYVLNGGQIPSWGEIPTPKYLPMFIKDSFNPKDLLTFTGVKQSHALIYTYPELLYTTEHLAEYAGKTFLRLYEQLYLNR